jgi:hypothetical protein
MQMCLQTTSSRPYRFSFESDCIPPAWQGTGKWGYNKDEVHYQRPDEIVVGALGLPHAALVTGTTR